MYLADEDVNKTSTQRRGTHYRYFTLFKLSVCHTIMSWRSRIFMLVCYYSKELYLSVLEQNWNMSHWILQGTCNWYVVFPIPRNCLNMLQHSGRIRHIIMPFAFCNCLLLTADGVNERRTTASGLHLWIVLHIMKSGIKMHKMTLWCILNLLKACKEQLYYSVHTRHY